MNFRESKELDKLAIGRWEGIDMMERIVMASAYRNAVQRPDG